MGEGKVLCAVSGGVDSSVMAALLIRAIGDRAVCVFVDHGLLRKDEAEQVIGTFGDHFSANFKAFDEHDRFFGLLAGVTDPEAKRKVIGAEFVRVFEDHADELQGCDFLAQGTLYPDVIESGSTTAAKIKTHHNVGGLPDWMRMKLIEPLRWLFKDEVRAVGRKLGLPDEMVDREPFPGPGLGVRVLGEVTPGARADGAGGRLDLPLGASRAGLAQGDLAKSTPPSSTCGASASWATSGPTSSPSSCARSRARTR